jgi:hypothetical protein
MVKTQVQIPDDLYRRAKEIAKEREISLAEVMRRGLEYMSRTHPPIPGGRFTLPVIDPERFVEDFDSLDLKGLSLEEEVKPIS